MTGRISTKFRNHIIIRRSYWLAKQFERWVKRRSAKDIDYQQMRPIFVNSFPKSGTHLLLQILQGVPEMTYYDSFLASMPPMPHRERSLKNHLNRLRQIAPGEILPGHLFFHPAYYQELLHKHVLIFFIYRDPRDVTISEAYYLTYMARWHGLHKYFSKNLTSMEDRISASILGIDDPEFPIHYPDIYQRFQRYKPWLECDEVFSIKFENLVGNQRADTIQLIAKHLESVGEFDLDIGRLAERLSQNIDPQRSRTFRTGKTGQWRELFTDRHTEQFKLVAGELLVELDYERDIDW